MNNGLIETYYTKEEGYHPFFIREHWQVAQLNYLPSLAFTAIERVEHHKNTDEIFVLTKGKAVLIGAVVDKTQVDFECTLMEQGVTYNIPADAWHNIAMSEDSEVIIVEKSNTHLNDVTYHLLADTDKSRLKEKIWQLINHSK